MPVPPILWLALAGAVLVLGVYGLRGLLAIGQALAEAEFERISPPPHWPATRALVGVLAALPVVFAARELGVVSLLAGGGIAALGYWVSPPLLEAARRRLQQQLLDDLALH